MDTNKVTLKKVIVFAALFMFAGTLSMQAVPISPFVKALDEVIVVASKTSGRVLSPAARKAAEESLEMLVKKYGDDVLLTVERGGLEALDLSAKYGDDFLKLCQKVEPSAVRFVVLHSDELVPIAKRIGPEFISFNAKHPYTAKEAVKIFGDESVHTLKNVSREDLIKLVGYAKKADSPATASYLYSSFQKSGRAILDHLDAKHILAYGLSYGMVKTAGGVGDAVRTVAEKAPEPIARSAGTGIVFCAVSGMLIVAVAFVCRFYRKIIWAIKAFMATFRKKRKSDHEKQ